MPTTFDVADRRFNYRVAAVILHDDAVLLHRSPGDDFWTLPGGRPELDEPSTSAIVRELREELAVEAWVERLLWIGEAFFDHDGRSWHELTLIFLCRLPDGSSPLATRGAFPGREGDRPLLFEWRRIDDLPREAVYPLFLADGLWNLPLSPAHVIDDERNVVMADRSSDNRGK